MLSERNRGWFSLPSEKLKMEEQKGGENIFKNSFISNRECTFFFLSFFFLVLLILLCSKLTISIFSVKFLSEISGIEFEESRRSRGM